MRHCGHAEGINAIHRRVPCHRLQRLEEGDRRSCRCSVRQFVFGSLQQESVFVLRSPSGSDQRTSVGGRRVPAPVQTLGQRRIPLASKRDRGKTPYRAGDTVASGGAGDRTAQSYTGKQTRSIILKSKGAKASAIIYSLAATAVANGLNVEEYFTALCQMKQILPWKEEPKYDPQA